MTSSKSRRSISSVGRRSRVARLVDANLAEHLADDDLDVFVVDGHALAAVDLLDFLHQIALDGVLAPRLEVLLRVDRAVRDGVAGADLPAVLDHQFGVVRDGVLALDRVLGADHDVVALADEEALGRGCHVRRLVGAVGPGDDLAGLDDVARRGEQLHAVGQGDVGVVLFAARDLDPCSGVAAKDLDDAIYVADLGLALRDPAFEELLDSRRPAVMSRPATPPVWNVRIVSCVPGSPMDWAAIMPTASPMPTSVPVARFRP